MKNPARLRAAVCTVACTLTLCSITTPAHAWGDEGHGIIGVIADHFLDPAVRTRVNALLAGDTTHLTPGTQIDQETTWADKFRDSDRNSTQVHYNETHNWHYVDLELAGPDLKSACFGEPALPAGTVASNGAPADCIVDKIDEFAAELGNPGTSGTERLLALQFLLHFVGDLHQPLHASDDHDQGGNLKTATAPGIKQNNLHHYWDTEFVNLQGASETAIAQQLIARITVVQRSAWSSGTASDWATESFNVSKAHAYGLLPAPSTPNNYALPASYVSDATAVVAEQLSKAGVRLAFVLNKALQ